MSDRIARLLVEEEGLVPGNRVPPARTKRGDVVRGLAGRAQGGGIVVATMPMLRPAEIATVLERAQVSHAIVDSRFIGDYRDAAAQAGTVRSLLRYDGDHGRGELETRLKSVAPGFAPVDTARDDVALIAFTSGTTGKPKGCVQYHRDILASADSFARHLLGPEPGQRWLCSAPIAFTFGLGMQLVFPLRFGGTAVTLEQASPAALLDAVERFGRQRPRHGAHRYKAMLGQLDGRSIASLDTCVSAGEHLPGATWDAWRERTGLSIVDGNRRDRDDAHLHLGVRRRHPAGRDRQGGARIPGGGARRRGESPSPRHRPPRGEGADRVPLFR
jgi:2-aminobenzoate-CoA ligase